MQSLSVVLCIGLAALSGCVANDAAPLPDGPDDTGPKARDTVTTTSTRPSATTTTSSGPPAASTSTSSDASQDGNGTAPSPDPIVVPVAFDGKFPFSACVPVDLDTCQYVYRESGAAESFMADEDGTATEYDFTVEWDANSPFTEEIAVWVDRVTSCGDSCWEFSDAHVEVGTSPIQVKGDATTLGEGPLRVWIRHTNALVSPVYGFAHPEQPFHVEGTVVYPAGVTPPA